jgi:hypothetical protein
MNLGRVSSATLMPSGFTAMTTPSKVPESLDLVHPTLISI